jgi:glycosyltransferase involved in cell wall biosynthesis
MSTDIPKSPNEPRLRIMVLGLRGVVDVQGGIETHARRLYPLLARLGCDVEIVQRSAYFPRERRRREWRGVKLTYLWSSRLRIVEPAVHTLLGVLYAAIRRPDVLHLHAVGPALLAPLARLLGLRVVVTHHAADYEREKWGPLAKALLRAGERFGVGFANRPIVVSPILKQVVESRYGVGATLIPNGAPLAMPRRTRHTLRRFDLLPRRYVLCVARLDPVKRQHDLIAAFRAARLPGWKLVLVGEVTTDRYSRRLVDEAARDPVIVLTGYQSGAALHELYSHAGLFVLPSALEGHPIALLEAAVFELPVLATAIPENLALPLPRSSYFPVGDTQALAAKLEEMTGAATARSAPERRAVHLAVRAEYSWRKAAELTSSVYRYVARGGLQHG